MKNLKKVLALGLALVMVLGMFTITASAAESKMTADQLTDWASVSHKDAVALMVDLGIINGIENADAKGTYAFKPTDTIDRASWAKMVYFAATGFDDADFYLGTNKTLKDITGNWAEAYISYLAADSVKIIAGDNEGNFKPDNNVTVAEAAKTLLVLLGYDPADRGYVNTSTWAQNVITDAKTFGLMANVDKDQTALVNLTRENAAEMVYNAMVTNTVKTSVQWDAGVQHITDYNKVETLGYKVFGAIAVEATVTSIDENGYAIWNTGSALSPSFIKTSNLKNVKASADVVGEQAIVFVEAENVIFNSEGKAESGDFVSVISTSVAKSADTADKVITNGVVWDDLTNSGKTNYVATKFADDCVYYVNGKNDSQTGRTNVDDIKAMMYDVRNDRTNPGPVVEFYLNDDGEIGLVKAYIHSVAQLTGDAETRTSGGTLQVRIPGLRATWTDAEKVSGYQGLKEDDVVLYYEGPNDTLVIEKAEVVTGKVTAANSNDQITVNGTRYSRTGLDLYSAPSAVKGKGISTPDGSSSNQTDFSAWYNRDDEFNFYLDKSGSVCFTEQVTESVSKSNVAIVLAAEWNGTNLDTASGTLRAKLLFSDGTTQVVTISKLDGLKVVTTKSATQADKEILGGDNKDSNARPAGTAIAQLDADVENAFYSYRVVDGKYELTKAVAGTGKDDWSRTVSFTNAAISKLTDFSNGKISYTATSKTVFIVAKGDPGEKEFYTYTSFKNVPEMKSASGMAIADNENPGVARYVYLDTTSYSDDTPEGYVFIYNNAWEEDADNDYAYLVNVVDVNGNRTTMSVSEDLRDAIAADSTNARNWNSNQYVGKFWSVAEISETGVVSELESAEYAPADIVAMGDDVVAVAGQSYDYDNITKFVYVDLVVDDKDRTNDASDDTLVFSECGEFDPERFWDAEDVDSSKVPGIDLVSSATASFASVKMTMISEDGYTADYIYVVRIAW